MHYPPIPRLRQPLIKNGAIRPGRNDASGGDVLIPVHIPADAPRLRLDDRARTSAARDVREYWEPQEWHIANTRWRVAYDGKPFFSVRA